MRIAVVARHSLTAALDTLVALENWLGSRHLDVVWTSEAAALMPPGERTIIDREDIARDTDLVVVLGGDGTLLAAAQIIARSGRDVPILGVNFGSLGFLTEITRPELFSSLEAVIDRRVEHDDRMLLWGTVGSRSHVALNDIVITRMALSRMVELDVTVGDQFVMSVRSDGLIIASPTGSTAYNLSAGGPIVHPGVDALLLTPIAPHTLTNRPVVIPVSSTIVIHPLRNSGHQDVFVTFDGQVGHPLSPDHYVRVTRATQSLRLVRPTARSYYEVLREKLKWAER